MVRDPGRFQRGEMFDKISGSPQYMAPELVGQRYDYRVDMRLGQALRPCFPSAFHELLPASAPRWAFGVLVYFALYGRYPFDGNNVREILLTVLHGTIEWDSDAPRLQWSAKPYDIKDWKLRAASHLTSRARYRLIQRPLPSLKDV